MEPYGIRSGCVVDKVLSICYIMIEVSERRNMSDKSKGGYVPKLTDSDELWKQFITRLLDEEAKAILRQVNSNPLLKNVKAPDVIKENLWKQIRKHERKKSFILIKK